jgi:septal ring factor EnvC (AmiA/AmiB activator)
MSQEIIEDQFWIIAKLTAQLNQANTRIESLEQQLKSKERTNVELRDALCKLVSAVEEHRDSPKVTYSKLSSTDIICVKSDDKLYAVLKEIKENL